MLPSLSPITKYVWQLLVARIVLEWNGEGQPVGDSGGLLTRFLGPIGRDFSYFPISYENWKKVPREYKRIAYENDIEGKFDIQSDLQKSYVFKSLGLRWRENRQDLWNARDDNTCTRDELIAMVPEGVNRDHWATFVEYRLSEKTKLNAQKNKENRKKQTIHHTTGSKSLARKRAEMEKDFGRKVSRGEVWTAAHKRPDGTFLNDQAKEISVSNEGSAHPTNPTNDATHSPTNLEPEE
ncbi:putative transposase, Ptta/En/Spm, plant [Sesbania bispinosa]|nr:putative transposase, Ptta/En/Spm, plant [Sesbania bispinosa]